MKQRSGKIKPNGIVEQANGPVFDKNDPAKFHGAGKSSGKTSSNGVVAEASGPIFHENSTHIPTMNADKPSKEKGMGSAKGHVNIKDHDTACDKTATQSGSGGPTDAPYALAKSYEKSGKTGSRPNRVMD